MHRGRTQGKQLGTRQQHRLPDAEIDGVKFSWPCPVATSKAIPILTPLKRGRDGRRWLDSEPPVLRRGAGFWGKAAALTMYAKRRGAGGRVISICYRVEPFGTDVCYNGSYDQRSGKGCARSRSDLAPGGTGGGGGLIGDDRGRVHGFARAFLGRSRGAFAERRRRAAGKVRDGRPVKATFDRYRRT
jgi:hypothetical protein